VTEQDYEQERADLMKRIQEARERGNRADEQQLQQELNYIDDAQYKRS